VEHEVPTDVDSDASSSDDDTSSDDDDDDDDDDEASDTVARAFGAAQAGFTAATKTQDARQFQTAICLYERALDLTRGGGAREGAFGDLALQCYAKRALCRLHLADVLPGIVGFNSERCVVEAEAHIRRARAECGQGLVSSTSWELLHLRGNCQEQLGAFQEGNDIYT